MQSVTPMGPSSYEAATTTHTQSPIVTGTSILAIVYKDGVMMAGDCLASYGKLARFRRVDRIKALNNTTILGGSGDYSDFQYVTEMLDKQVISDAIEMDGHTLQPSHFFEYLSNVMYQRRSKMNPLWNSFVVAGVERGKPFLFAVDMRGTTYSSSTIATGFGAYLAQPILRKAVAGNETSLTEEEARATLEDCMRVLLYRDGVSLNLMRIAKVTKDGAVVSEPYSLETNWDVAAYVKGYGA